MRETTIAVLIAFFLRILILRKWKTQLEKTTLAAACIMLIASIIGIIFNEYSLIKLHPILMSISFCAVFTASLGKGKMPIVEAIARIQEPNLPSHAIGYTRNVTKVWIAFFVLNGLISFYTYRYSSMDVWTLYNGLISYVLMGVLFGVEFLVRLKIKKKWEAQKC